MMNITSVFINSVERAVGNSVGQNKPLIVYITNEEVQDEWLQSLLNETILQAIKDKSIALKLIKGSNECTMFEQIFPNVIVPSIFCVRVSSVLDVIYGEITSEEFTTRLGKVLNNSVISAPVQHQAQTSVQSEPQRQAQPQTQQTAQPSHIIEVTSMTTPIDSTQTSTPDTSSPTFVSSKPSTSTERDHKSLKEQAAELSAKRYREEQIRKGQQAKEEKARIRRLLKADEEERRIEREQAQRERERRLSKEYEKFDDEHRIDEIIHEHEATLKENIRRRLPSSSGDMCSLSIRLLSGHSLRHAFKVIDTLNDVRKWVDENRTDGDKPYCFHRTIPRITFGVTDEEKSLESLELVPRSALILKPFTSYTNAYGGKGATGNQPASLLSRIFGGFTSFWSMNNNDDIDLSRSSQSGPACSSYRPHEGPFEAPVSPAQSSQNGSPNQSPVFSNTGPLNLAHPSALNLNLHNTQPTLLTPNQLTSAQISRSGSPLLLPSLAGIDSNIRTLNNNATTDDRNTYNGNNIDLEDDNKSKTS